MSRFINLIGKKFNNLTVISDSAKVGKNRMVICKCDCGNETIVQAGHLKDGHTQSCGCKQITHGMRYSSEYKAYYQMLTRCYNENTEMYPIYGGRGIKVCDRWLESFDNFFADMGLKPTPNHSLDRFPNVNGDYELSNCRWATTHDQTRNQRTNRWIEYDGKRLILQDWANLFKVTSGAVNKMIKLYGIEYSFIHYYKKLNR